MEWNSSLETECTLIPDRLTVQSVLIVVVVEQVIEWVVTTLLHDTVELIRVDLAITVAVRLINHVLRRINEMHAEHVLLKAGDRVLLPSGRSCVVTRRVDR